MMSNMGLVRPAYDRWTCKLYGPVHTDELKIFASQLSYSGLEAAALLASLRASPEPFYIPVPSRERTVAHNTEHRLKPRVSPPKILGPRRPKEPKVNYSW